MANLKCRVCGFEYHDCGSCGNPAYMGRGFCDFSCYRIHRDKVTKEILDKYKVSLEDYTSILCDLWDAGVDADYYF